MTRRSTIGVIHKVQVFYRSFRKLPELSDSSVQYVVVLTCKRSSAKHCVKDDTKNRYEVVHRHSINIFNEAQFSSKLQLYIVWCVVHLTDIRHWSTLYSPIFNIVMASTDVDSAAAVWHLIYHLSGV
jgi:hypothetical protein